MKKLMILLAVSTISLSAICQETKPVQDSSKVHQVLKEGAVMKDGKVKVWKNGNSSVLTYGTLKLNNGSQVYPDGTVKNADGTSIVLSNGEYIDMEGQIGTVKRPKDD